MSDRENNRIQIFDTSGKLIKTWNHLGSTQGIWISPKDEMYILTHRNNVENITADTLAGRLMKIDLESGKVLGSMESPGHSVNGSPNGDIFVGSLTGNVCGGCRIRSSLALTDASPRLKRGRRIGLSSNI